MKIINRHWQIIVLSLIAWTLFGVFFALQNYVNAVYFGQDISSWTTLAVWLICGYAWMLLTPLVVARYRKIAGSSGRSKTKLFSLGFITG